MKKVKVLSIFLSLIFLLFSSCDERLPTALIADIMDEISLNKEIIFDGSASAAPNQIDQEKLIYHWSIELKPISSKLSIDPKNITSTLKIKPDVPGKFIFSLITEINGKKSKPYTMIIRVPGYGFESFGLILNEISYNAIATAAVHKNADIRYEISLPQGDYSSLKSFFSISQGTVKLVLDIEARTLSSNVISNETLLDFTHIRYLAIVDQSNSIKQIVEIISISNGIIGPNKSSKKDLIDFTLVVDSTNPLIQTPIAASKTGTQIIVEVPLGINLNHLKCEFSLTGGKATLNSNEIQSGDFFDMIPTPTFKITAENGSFRNYSIEIVEKLSLSMKNVPEYSGGSPALQMGSAPAPTPTLIKEFRICKTPIPYSYWYKVKKWAEDNKGYLFKHAGQEGSEGSEGAIPLYLGKPVINISFADTVVWCNALSQMQGKTPVYYINSYQYAVVKNSNNVSTIDLFKVNAANNSCVKWNATGFRLPTLAQWDYSARFESTQPHPTAAASFVNNGSPLSSTKITPNALGLFRMASDPQEFCWDWYSTPFTEANYKVENPIGPETGTGRTLTGASAVAGNNHYTQAPLSPTTQMASFRVVSGGFEKNFNSDRKITSLNINTTGRPNAAELSNLTITQDSVDTTKYTTTVTVDALPYGTLSSVTLNLDYLGKKLECYVDGNLIHSHLAGNGSSLSIDCGALFNYRMGVGKSLMIEVTAQDDTFTQYNFILKESLPQQLYISSSALDDTGIGTKALPIKTIDEAFTRIDNYKSQQTHTFSKLVFATGNYLANTAKTIDDPLTLEGGWNSNFSSQNKTATQRETMAIASTIDFNASSECCFLSYGGTGDLLIDGMVINIDAGNHPLVAFKTPNAHSNIIIKQSSLFLKNSNSTSLINTDADSTNVKVIASHLSIEANFNSANYIFKFTGKTKLSLFHSIVEIKNKQSVTQSSFNIFIFGKVVGGSLIYNNSFAFSKSSNNTAMQLTDSDNPSISIANNLFYLTTPGTNDKGIIESQSCTIEYKNNAFSKDFKYVINHKDTNKKYDSYSGHESYEGLKVFNNIPNNADNYDFPFTITSFPAVNDQLPWIYAKGGLNLSTQIVAAGIDQTLASKDFWGSPRTVVGIKKWTLGAVEFDAPTAMTQIGYDIDNGTLTLTEAPEDSQITITPTDQKSGTIALPVGKIASFNYSIPNGYTLNTIGYAQYLQPISQNSTTVTLYPESSTHSAMHFYATPNSDTVDINLVGTGITYPNNQLIWQVPSSGNTTNATLNGDTLFGKWEFPTNISCSNPYDINATFGVINSTGAPFTIKAITAVKLATYFVDKNATGDNNGNSWTNAFTDLNLALHFANMLTNTTTTIKIAKGLYIPTLKQADYGTEAKFCSFYIKKNLTLEGGYPTGGGSFDPRANITQLSGDVSKNDLPRIERKSTTGDIYFIPDLPSISYDNSVLNDNVLHVINIINPTAPLTPRVPVVVSLSGLVISGGSASTPEFSHNNGGVNKNRNESGGGINMDNDVELTLSQSIIAGNRSHGNNGRGGGIYFAQGTKGVISQSVFEYNIADGEYGTGGAVGSYRHPSDPESSLLYNDLKISNSLFINNTARTKGGALYSYKCNIDYSNLTFFNNKILNTGNGSENVISIFFLQGTINLANLLMWKDNPLNNHFNFTLSNMKYSYANGESLTDGVNCIDATMHTLNPFIDSTNPIGIDLVWGTQDDGLRVHHLSQAWDHSFALSGAFYTTDLSGNNRAARKNSIGCYSEENKKTISIIYDSSDSSDQALTNTIEPELKTAVGTFSPIVRKIDCHLFTQNPALNQSNLIIIMPKTYDYFNDSLNLSSKTLLTNTGSSSPKICMGTELPSLFYSGSLLPTGTESKKKISYDPSSGTNIFTALYTITSPMFIKTDSSNSAISYIEKPNNPAQNLKFIGKVSGNKYGIVFDTSSNKRIGMWGILEDSNQWSDDCKHLFINFSNYVINLN